ncbi:RNA 2',3'-cyclic phosphodiesterase [Shimia sp. FJ5]|uniref:RNA 2',3'-cyclic phosphodiesterase n=1 Tax=Shimia sp. FJ5 TaxID=3079054 RepID=UPI002619FF26|nr:RNA 2',3'-cyclic phosphodiesterase [Shimia sp. FJ5]MDV4145752.1 RNA 2',3'-cyclic phosphodiesterase [Shimia sp. FJ5]
MRAFLALDLPEEMRAAVASLQDQLRVGRKPPAENLHLTLAFLDDQPEAVLAELHEALQGERLPEIHLALQGLELFGGARPRVLYAKGEGGAALVALHRTVRRVARDVGIELSRERFRPHVTLARFRPHVTLARFRRDMSEDEAVKLGQFMARCGDWQFSEAPIAALCLFGSELHPDGAVHDVLAGYPLG